MWICGNVCYRRKNHTRWNFIWVKGHDGHEMNERCDYLTTSAADGDNLVGGPGDRIKKKNMYFNYINS